MARTSFPVWSLFLLLSSLISHTPTLLANHDKTSVSWSTLRCTCMHGSLLILSTYKIVWHTQVYIFYMGETKHDSPTMTEETHHTMLASVLGRSIYTFHIHL